MQQRAFLSAKRIGHEREEAARRAVFDDAEAGACLQNLGVYLGATRRAEWPVPSQPVVVHASSMPLTPTAR